MHRDAEYHLTKRELECLIRGTTSDRDRALVTLFVDTGIRRFEAAQLVCEDFEPAEPLLIVRRGKGDKLRILPVSSRLKAILQPLVKPAPELSIFRNQNGAPLSTRQINRIVAKAGRRAGIHNPNPRHKNVTCHLLRHSFARLWKNAGGSIEALARILGHSSVKTTWDLYGRPSIQDIKRSYQATIRKIALDTD